MSVNEQQLLDSWTSERDAEAFKAIANRYAGLVYATCRRILGNDSDAEDVAQECFVALAGAGRKPGGFLGAWLHRVATNKSLTRIRGERNRRSREEVWQQAGADPVAAAMHRDLCAVVDEAIARLPDDLRVPLVAHFIEDKTHDAIATDLGVSRQTVTYRIGKGIERIRRRLQVNAIAFSVVSLSELLKPASKTPASLLAELGKLALAGPVAPVTGVTAFTVAKVAAVALAIVCVGGLATVHFIHAHNRAKADAAWREIAQTATSTPVPAKTTVSPAQPAPQEPAKSASNQTESSGNTTQPSASSVAADAPAPVPSDSFQPYSFVRDYYVNGEVRRSDRIFVLSPAIWRMEDSNGNVNIGDSRTGVSLQILPEERRVIRTTSPDDPPNDITSADKMACEWGKAYGAKAQSLGTIHLENKECRGLHSVGKDQEDTIWIDTQTNLPVRIERRPVKEGYRSVESQFRFGVDTDPALANMTPPEGYEVKEEVQHRPLGYRLSMFWRGIWNSI